MNKNIKLVAIDLDGTLLKSYRTMPDANIFAIRKLIKHGYKVLIATGGDLNRTSGIINNLDLPNHNLFCLSFNGGVIYSFEQHKIIHKETFSKAETIAIYELADKYNIAIWGYPEKESEIAYTGHKTGLFIGVNKIMSGYRTFLFNSEKPVRLIKFLLRGKPKNTKIFLDELKKAFKHNVFQSWIWRGKYSLYEIVPNSVDKQIGLKFLLEHYKIKPSEVMAIGDGYNDIGMLKYVGLPIAMGNAYEDVKAVCKDVTAGNREAGVAKAIDKWIFNAND